MIFNLLLVIFVLFVMGFVVCGYLLLVKILKCDVFVYFVGGIICIIVVVLVCFVFWDVLLVFFDGFVLSD